MLIDTVVYLLHFGRKPKRPRVVYCVVCVSLWPQAFKRILGIHMFQMRYGKRFGHVYGQAMYNSRYRHKPKRDQDDDAMMQLMQYGKRFEV